VVQPVIAIATTSRAGFLEMHRELGGTNLL
jgi:hypothetical protein